MHVYLYVGNVKFVDNENYLGKILSSQLVLRKVHLEGGSNLPAMQRVYHPDNEKQQSSQPKYKLLSCSMSSQVYPVVMRLLKPVEEINNAQVLF